MIEYIIEFLIDHMLLIVGSVALLIFIRRMAPAVFTGWREKISPLYPLILCVLGAFCGLTDYIGIAEIVAVGLICGLIAAYVFKLSKPILQQIFKRTFGVELPE